MLEVEPEEFFMLITKAINNNVVLAEDENGRELVLFGKGLGFRGALPILRTSPISNAAFAT